MKRLLTILSVLLALTGGCDWCTTRAQTGWFIPSNRFSSGVINDLCHDGYGYTWIATDYGVNKFDGYRFTTFVHQPDDSTSISSNFVGCLYNDRDSSLWIGTAKGIDRYDYATGRFIHYPFDNGAKPRVTKIVSLNDGRLLVCTSGFSGFYTLTDNSFTRWVEGDTTTRFVNSVMTDSEGRFWQCGFGNEMTVKDRYGQHRMVSTQGFVVDFAMRGDEVLIFCLHGIHSYRNGQLTVADIDKSALGPDAVIRCICTDSKGNIYIGTRGDGLFRLPSNSRRIERVEAATPELNLNTAKVWAISEDRQGNIWLGCQSKGLLILPARQPQFSTWSFASQGSNIGSTVTSICQGDRGMTWCTVQGNGVFGFDSLGHIAARPQAPASAECIYRDRRKRYWIGTGDALYAYNPLTGQAQHQLTFDCDKLDNMVDDSLGRLYVSVFSKGFLRYDPATREMRHFNSNQKDNQRGWLCNNWIMAMMTDHQGRVWFATSSGVSCYDPVADSFRPMGWHQLLNGTLCFSLCETRQGNILIGTESGLYVYQPGEQEAKPFPASTDVPGRAADGLRDKTVGYIVEAANGDLWCSTSMGIWQWDADKQQFIGHVNGNGLTEKEYINCVGLHTADNAIYFANNGGLTVFRPSQVTGSHTSLPDVKLTGFYVAGKPQPLTPLTSHLSPLTSHPTPITVSYLDNLLTLEFSLLDYNDPDNIIYEYRLGNSEWIQNAEGQNSIQLSRLQPGTYNIEVRAMAAGIYSPSTTITIKVTPPWYRSTVAYVLYLLAVVGIIGLAGWLWRRRTRMQMDEEKMKFLINATHDIRSPLTLIMGALGKLKNLRIEGLNSSQLSALNEQLSTPVDAIDRNAQRLLQLVNQILDERRIDKNQLQLHCRETNLVDFISAICKLYQYNASQRNITFTFEHDKDHVLAWIDRINFDKVISNLLSNAFKYTYDGGEVKVVLREVEQRVEIQVVDNGVGFNKNDDLDRLFDRFFQGHNADSLGMQGTGIGLNLSRNIVQMHGGQIKAQHRSDGQQGACFTVSLPQGKNHLRPEQIVTDSPAKEVLSVGSSRQAGRKFHILIADDDPEIAGYIISELGDKYRFTHCPNGKEALKAILNGGFDLVVSDVMMPEMDGISLLKHIKENPAISELPVIMLTSKAENSDKLKGLKSGADAYIAKPFSMEELHIQIDNLIDNVRRLRGKFSGAAQQEERVENIELKGNNDALMERIMRSVNAHLSDSDFNVDMLSADVGISRAQLHRKMKEITGIPSGKFLRNLRMEQAARLLREGKVNVAQVADSVGYNDPSHFSTVFKNHFGLSPSEYVESHHANPQHLTPNT